MKDNSTCTSIQKGAQRRAEILQAHCFTRAWPEKDGSISFDARKPILRKQRETAVISKNNGYGDSADEIYCINREAETDRRAGSHQSIRPSARNISMDEVNDPLLANTTAMVSARVRLILIGKAEGLTQTRR